MTKKASKLINENVIRRWGKLANMPALTENFLENLEDETVEEAAHEDEMDAAEDEIAAGEAEVEAGEEAEASLEEKEAVEDIVRAVVDAIAAETGVDIEVEGEAGDEDAMDDMDAGMDASDELDDDADMDMDDADAAMRDKNVNPRMRDPEMRDMAYNRDDELEEGKHGMGKGDQSKTRADYEGNKDKDPKADKKAREKYDKKSKDSGARKGDQSKSKADFEEALDLEIVDDEALTEAVLARVVERLLKKN